MAAPCGILVGLLKALWTAVKAVADFIAKLLWYTGLFVPALYAVFGCVLYLVWQFDPFAAGTYPMLYRIGFYLSVGVAVIIVYRRLTKGRREKRRAKEKEEAERMRAEEAAVRRLERERKRDEARRDNGYRARYIKKKREERRDARHAKKERAESDLRKRADYDDYDTNGSYFARGGSQNDDYGYLDEEYSVKETRQDSVAPAIYMSALEPDTLIHDYPDRFEVYKLDGGKKTLDRIEYK